MPKLRLISASERPLSASGLRADLCERLAEGLSWRVPALAERTEDIPGLVAAFVRELDETRNVKAHFTDDALEALRLMEWPGQIRALRSTIRTLAFTCLGVREEVAIIRGADVMRRHEEGG